MALKRVFARFFLRRTTGITGEARWSLWWIGNAILLFVVLPVVIALLNRVLAAVERIRAACDDILAHGVELLGEVDGCRSSWRRPTPPCPRSPSAPPATRAASRRCSALLNSGPEIARRVSPVTTILIPEEKEA